MWEIRQREKERRRKRREQLRPSTFERFCFWFSRDLYEQRHRRTAEWCATLVDRATTAASAGRWGPALGWASLAVLLWWLRTARLRMPLGILLAALCTRRGCIWLVLFYVLAWGVIGAVVALSALLAAVSDAVRWATGG